MKKYLDEYLQKEKKKIKTLYSFEFRDWLKENYPKDDIEKIMNFYREEKKRLVKRDIDYNKKRVRKSVSFDITEYQLIEDKMNKIGTKDFSNFAKNILLKKKIISKTDKELIFEINKIGNNLNQIAKSVNKGEKVAVLTQLVEIEKALKDLKK